METTPYQMCINNITSYLLNLTQKDKESGEFLNAFRLSESLAIAFCKSKEDVLMDIVQNINVKKVN